MDERRMTADVELLPVAVSPYTDRILAAVRTQGCADPLFRILDDYARACVAHATAAKDAEIEALRSEVRRLWERDAEWNRTAGEAVARAERLAEALIAWHKQATDKGRREREESPGHSHAVLGVWDSDNGKYAGVECAQCALWFEATRLRTALDQEGGNG